MRKDDVLNDRRAVPAGSLMVYGETFELDGRTYAVDEPCRTTYGRWYCVRHSLAPRYQQDAEEHGGASCAWVWVCYAHIHNNVVEYVVRKRARRGGSRPQAFARHLNSDEGGDGDGG
jgi:hypothetical protein